MHPRSKITASTLVELMIALAIVSLAGAGVFEILRTGLILGSKNTSINLSHQQSRFALIQLQNDLNSAVSTPELTDSAGNILSSGSSSGPAAGVSFQDYAGGPYCLYVSSTSTIPATATSIQVITGSNFQPLPGQYIHIQAVPLTATSTSSLLEALLSGASRYTSSSTTSGITYTPTLATAIGGTINLRDPVTGNPLSVASFFTTPVIYVVQNGQLVKYTLDPAGTGRMLPTVMAYDVSTPTPFSMPSVNSSPQNLFLMVQDLTALDPSSSNRGYHSVTAQMTLQIPHFAQMTVKY